MPTVPRYEQPRVEPNLGRTPRFSTEAPIEAFGGGGAATTSALREGLGAAEKVVLEIKERADDAAVQEATNKLTVRQQQRQIEVMQRKGKDAIGVSDDVFPKFDSDISEIENELTTAQKAKFAAKRDALKNSFRLSTEKHSLAEIEKYEVDTQAAAIDVARNDAVFNYLDQAKIDASLVSQDEAIDKLAKIRGHDPKWVEGAKREARSKTHAAIIERALDNGQDLLAMQYRERFKGEITTKEEIERVEQKLMRGITDGEGDRTSTRLYRKHGQGGQATAIRELESMDLPTKIKDNARQRLEHMYSAARTAKINDDSAVADQLMKLIKAGVPFERLPKSLKNRMSPEALDGVEKYAASADDQSNLEEKTRQYYYYLGMATDPATRKKFADLDFWVARPNLTQKQYDELHGIWKQSRLEKDKADPILDGYRSDMQIVDGALQRAGIDPRPRSKSAETEVALFREVHEREVIARQQVLGRKMTHIEKTDLANELLKEQIVKKNRIFPDKKMTNFEIKAQLTPEIRDQIKRAIVKNRPPGSENEQVTEKEIVDTYIEAVKSGTIKPE